jgi:UDP-glucose 4-epimerase
MKCFVTGGAGFIGSHLIDRLMTDGHAVVAFDNLSLGREDLIRHHYSNRAFRFVKGNLLDLALLQSSMADSDVVFHLAANSDIVKSAADTRIDLEQGTIATYNVLDAMRICGVKRIVFTSSSVVYGEVERLPIHEDHGPLFPISFYGASKLAGEALVSAYCHNCDFRSWIYRFANVIGTRATHGVVLDFYRKLQRNNEELEIFGDGKQAKPYIAVHDVDGVLFGLTHSSDSVNYFNLGTDGQTSVSAIAEEVTRLLGLRDVKFRFTGGDRGWPGDVPRVGLDMEKMKSLGWKPKYTSSDEACMAGIAAIIGELQRSAKRISL